MGKPGHGLAGAWPNRVIGGILTWLLRLLPEDYQANILAVQEQLVEQECSPEALNWGTWAAILGCCVALIRKTPLAVQETLAVIDPGYTGRIYGIYGEAAVAQVNAEFLEDHYVSTLPSMRVSGILVIAFYLLFGVLDFWCLPETRTTAWVIKAVIAAFLTVTTALSFRPNLFKPYSQQITSVSLFVAGLGVIVIIALSHPGELGRNTYYTGLMLLDFYIFLNSGLRFPYAVAVGLGLLCCYEATEIPRWQSLDSSYAYLLTFNNNFFLITALIVGATACNLFERTVRLNFLIRYAIATSLRNFLHFFEYQDPERFLANIREIRHSPERFKQFLLQSYAPPKLTLSGELETVLKRSLPAATDEENEETGETQETALLEARQPTLLEHLSVWGKRVSARILAINPSFLQAGYAEEGQPILAKIEQAFFQDYFKSSLTSIRATIIYAFLFYGLFGLADLVCLPETNRIALSIRLLFCLYVLVVWSFSFREAFFERFHQALIVVCGSFAGVGIVVMILCSKPSELGYTTYYSGLVQVLSYIFIFARLLFPNALLVGLIIVVSYELAAVFFQDLLQSPERLAMFINNSVFVMTACVIGAIACNFFERNLRLDFLTRYTIAHKAQELLAYYERINPSPRELLDMINGIRHSPRKLKEFLMRLVAFQQEME